MMKSKVIGLLLSVVAAVTMQAQERRTEVRVIFPVDVTILNPAFGENEERLDRIISLIDSTRNSHSRLRLAGVAFDGWASPEGGEKHNHWLAEERRAALADYVLKRVSVPDSLLTFNYSAVNWEGLVHQLEADTVMEFKDEVLDIIAHEPERTFDTQGQVKKTRRGRLMRLRGGKPWRYMLTRYFPELRNASAVIVTYCEEPKPEPVVTDTLIAQADLAAPDPMPPDTVFAPMPEKPNRYWSLHTNMLYDLLAVPNLGAEIYLGRHVSLMGNWMYGWWKSDRVHRYWRIYGGEIAVRRWFGSLAKEKPLTGHHIGLYGQVLTYDFEFGGKGNIGGVPGGSIFDHPSCGLGVEYGFALPIARRLNIDFNIGIGYFGGRYYEYRPRDEHYVWQATKRRNWFGPTKLQASLTWLLGHGNFNKKGGTR